MEPTSAKKHGLCDFEFVLHHLLSMYLSALFCFLHLSMGIMLIIFGNFTNSGSFALWAITNKPWPAIVMTDDLKSAANYLLFLQWTCWICAAICFVLVFFMACLGLNYYSLICSPRPWVKQSWNKARKDATDAIEFPYRDEDKHETEDSGVEIKLWKTMTTEQRAEMAKYHPEGMFVPLVSSTKYRGQEIV